MTRYRTIVADPPWKTTAGPGWASGGRSRPLEYPTMSLDAIKALPVADVADDVCHLYLWTTNGYLEASYAVARAWGFTPSTTLVWAKRPMGLGLGGGWTITTEFVLFAWKGSGSVKRRGPSTWFTWPRGRHSAKPEAFQDLVEQVSPGPYLELFARRQRLGWDTWGNEAFCHIDLQPARGVSS